jgi:hypothetical protein
MPYIMIRTPSFICRPFCIAWTALVMITFTGCKFEDLESSTLAKRLQTAALIEQRKGFTKEQESIMETTENLLKEVEVTQPEFATELAKLKSDLAEASVEAAEINARLAEKEQFLRNYTQKFPSK